MGDDTRRDITLREYAPRSQLRTERHHVARPRFPAVDIHNHLGEDFGGDWYRRSPQELGSVLDEAGVELLVDLDGGQGDDLSREIERWRPAGSERVVVFAGLDYGHWATEPDFGEVEAERLRDSAARGARGLKVWKLLGLRARDPSGRLVPVDDSRLDPLWRTAAELRLPVLIHVGDPYAFFEPADETNERWEELEDQSRLALLADAIDPGRGRVPAAARR